MDQTMHAPVDIGEIPSLAIEAAILAGDDGQINSLARQCDDPRVFYESLKTHAFNASWVKTRKTSERVFCNSTLFMWPIILSEDRHLFSQTVEPVSQGLVRAFSSLSEGIRAASQDTDVHLLTRAFSYSAICAINAIGFRDLLADLSKGRASASINASVMSHNVPDGAPVLAFHIGSLTNPRTWPTLNQKHPKLRDAMARLKSVIDFTYSNTNEVLVEDSSFGEMDFADVAIEKGISLWLSAMDRKFKFKNWDAIPIHDGIIEISISLENDELDPVVTQLSCCQIGIDGIERVLSHIGGICKSMQKRTMN